MHATHSAGPRYSVIIPARNEAARIEQTLQTYLQCFERNADYSFELLVVANSCTDQTEKIVESLMKEHPSLRLISHSEPGKGRAILEGLRQSQGESVLFCDADGSSEAEDLLKLLKIVAEGQYDCAIGSRWLPESNVPVPQPLRRRIASRIFNLAVRIILGLKYKDTQCGAKAFNKKAKEIILQKVTSIGYQFDCDVLWQLGQANLKVLEVPITWRDSGGSGIRVGRDGTKMLTSLLKIRFK